MPNAVISEFALWLQERCDFLRNLEAEAERVLQKDKDTDKYKALMCQKAMFLQALPGEAEQYAAGLPGDVARAALEQLRRFSSNASHALSLDSVFYMSALLYPDNHVKGEPNNLERLAAGMKNLAEQQASSVFAPTETGAP